MSPARARSAAGDEPADAPAASEQPVASETSESGGTHAEEQDAAALLARAAAEGIHCLAIPTPFAVGRVNAYLIEDEPLTLVDSGPNSAKALDELEQALAARGHAIEDLELLVITHQHIDHIGLAAILARRSGAPVAALAGLDRRLRDYRSEAEYDDRFAARIMLRHGVPTDVVTALRAVSASFQAWGCTVEVDRVLEAGEELKLRDRTLRVLHRPGHSPSDTVFHDEQRRLLVAGDHLLAHISSNPLIARPLEVEGDYDGQRPQALITYLESLAKTRAMDLELVLGGHGAPISAHAALIDERNRMHERRAEKIRRLVAERPRTAYEVAYEMWGNVAVTQAYLTISEVLGHVDLLLRDGRVSEAVTDGIARFAAA
ncbi:MAG TPA: MBL fold metallo-hydrolase [Solirubrobacteraceae bacterium]|jgi:glyoxylase-like metal-dependent hydrolase (beta-lactamase superfamily II)|nr:MBL fold metallo-hydrolase [Solirubrobacteraceae bacterium]